jgi:DNA-binding HxlR family transcriptional regulator
LILETLENAGQKMSKNQICNSIKRRRTDIYQTLEKLERDLAVEKTNHPTNNTWFLYEITDLGRTLL